MITSSPYPGLRPFQQDEAHLFFGREAQVEDMLARLEAHRFLAVIGTSGCGKSSLVRAGLIPALEQGFLSDAEPDWRIAVMRPGSAPFDHLTTELLQDAALGCERHHTSEAASLLQATLRRGPLGLVEAVRESHLPEGLNLLLVVDQFEEIFRYRDQAINVNDADAFVNLLLASAQLRQLGVPIYVVITMRSDFIGDCALFPDLPEAINDSQFLTPRLTREQYRAAIVEPALVANGQLAEPLVNRLLNDLRGEPDQLPVLQHALMRMWSQTANDAPTRVLTLSDYESVGGLTGALSKHCNEILKHDLTPEQRHIAEVMFRALCERGLDQRDTRRPVKLDEVAAIAGVDVEAVKPVVDAFRGPERNFLMPPQPTTLDANTTLDISHESLIRQWQTLNTWVIAEAESARQYQRLEDAAKRRQQREGAELWRGVDLANARAWKANETPSQAWAARYGDAYQLAMDFLEASEAEEQRQRDQAEEARQRELDQARALADAQRARAEEQAARAAEQAKSANRLKVIAVVIGVLLLVTIGVAIYANHQRNTATKAQRDAEQAQQHAEKKEQEAIRSAKEAEMQRQAAVAAAEEAERQQEIAEQQRRVALVRLARYFSAASKERLESQPPLSALLGVEAVKAALISTAEEALRNAVARIGGLPLVGHEAAVFGVAFSPDGKLLATASWDDTVRLWSTSDLTTPPQVLRGHESRVNSVAFSPDGKLLATASADKTVRLWPVVADDLIRMACLFSGRNFSYEEWQLFLSDEPYRKTCRSRPLHPSFRKVVRERIKNGDTEDAVTQLQKALQEDGDLDTNLEKETRRLVAPVLVEIGQELIQEGEIKAAITAFAEAQVSDSNFEISAQNWNALCLFGSLGGFAADVMAACEQAVALEPQDGGIRDSRGIARALTGNFRGAIEDFQRFVEWRAENGSPEAKLRQEWIQMLQTNQNPFTGELLQQLRDQ